MKMKPLSIALALAALLLAGCSQAPNADDAAEQGTTADDMDMSAAEQAQMTEQAKPATAETGQPTRTANASGTVKSVDAATGKITIAHGPVEALQWPAMTMAFKATPDQVAAVQAGQKVEFEFESKGMEATITRISPTK